MLADEIARLSKGNAHLRSQLSDKNQNILMSGLTFEEIKTILAGKDLLNIIKNKKYEFIGKFFANSSYEENVYKEMYRLGLLSYDGSFYKVSDSGYTVLNLLEAEEFRKEMHKNHIHLDGKRYYWDLFFTACHALLTLDVLSAVRQTRYHHMMKACSYIPVLGSHLVGSRLPFTRLYREETKAIAKAINDLAMIEEWQ